MPDSQKRENSVLFRFTESTTVKTRDTTKSSERSAFSLFLVFAPFVLSAQELVKC